MKRYLPYASKLFGQPTFVYIDHTKRPIDFDELTVFFDDGDEDIARLDVPQDDEESFTDEVL